MALSTQITSHNTYLDYHTFNFQAFKLSNFPVIQVFSNQAVMAPNDLMISIIDSTTVTILCQDSMAMVDFLD